MFSSRDRSRRDVSRFPHRQSRGTTRLAGARRAAGCDRERRARHRDGGPLQRGGPRRGRDRGKRLFQRLHRIDGVVQALSPIAAQLFGGKQLERIGEETRQTVWLALGLGVLGVLLLAFPEPFLRLAGAPPQVEARTRAYLQGIAWALPAMLLFRVFFALTTAVSRPRAVMAINLVYFAAKIPLNALFIYGALGAPELGGPGCAVATAIASWLIFALAWIYCAKHPVYAPVRVFCRS